MFRLDKRKIFLLYQHCLLDRINSEEGEEESIKNIERITWFNNCLEKEKFFSEKIAKKLKVGWEFYRLPPLEKAILIYACYELFSEQNSKYVKLIIDQVINFSKVYLEEIKYKYINKVLDLLIKEEKNTSVI